MKKVVQHKLLKWGIGAAFFAVLGATSLAHAGNSQAQTITNRLNQLDNQIQTISRYVYQGGEVPSGAVSPSASSATAPSAGYIAGVEDRLTSMEMQIRELTGKVETLEHRLSQEMKKNSLLELQAQEEKKKTKLSDLLPPVENKKPETVIEIKEEKTELDQASVDGADSALTISNANEAYDAAFGLVKKAQYDDAEKAFTNFLAKHPDHDLVENARYWLGETYYVRGQYDKAAVYFAESYQESPKGRKAADNLLKLGMSLGKLGKKQDACLSLSELTKRFPDAPSSTKQRVAQQQESLGCL